MENKVVKAALVIILIIAITVADFIWVGMNLVTYALENINNSTSNSNVKFAAYFKNEQGAEVSQTNYEINNSKMKLYMEITVENEGYFDGEITLGNSNFKLKQEILSDGISKIEGNAITLNRVRAGNTVEIEVGIEPIVDEVYAVDMLNKESALKLTGNYKDSTEKNISIKSEKNVTLSLLAPTSLETTLEGKVITNRIYKIGEVNKRIVQLELNSSVLENEYPVKSTTFEVGLPNEVEKVEVITKGTYATNGEADRKLEHSIDNQKLTVKIENTSKDGKISWKKQESDNIIVTMILPEGFTLGTEEYNAKIKVEFYGQEAKTLEKEVKYNLTKEADGIIRTSIENKEEIYKGKIYSKEEREYNSTTKIEVNYANLIEGASIEEKVVYRLEEESENKQSNIQYKTTTISKSEFDKVLGLDGKLTIKDQNGNIIKEITKDTEVDENGNYIVTYAEGVKKLKVEITKLFSTGVIRLNHTKVIKVENYTREEIKALNYLVEQATVKYSTAEYSFEKRKNLRETKSVAELTAVPQSLSTITVNEQVKMSVTLKTDSEKYDLYKNPTITVKLPNGIKNVTNLKVVGLYLDNFKINSQYNRETREIQISLSGEQTQYNIGNTNGYIEILADIELDETMPNRQDIITVSITNQKAIEYQNEGKIESLVNISGHSGLVAFNSITNYNLKTNSVTTKDEQVGNLKMYQDATIANFQISLLNNTGNDLGNIKVVGNLPVEGNVTIGNNKLENTIKATLKSAINTQNQEAIVYYTANRNATNNLEDRSNQWNANLEEVDNPVLYMIVISNMSKGTNFTADYTMEIPANLEHNKDLKTTYVVDYASEYKTRTVKAIPVGLETGKVLARLDATVGTDKLENDMVVKSGEVIRYKLTIKNTGSSDVSNVKINGLVPEGTIYVEPVEEFEHAGEIYYQETEKSIVEATIDKLQSKETKTFEYEVRVKNDITAKSISNQGTITYGENIEVKSNKLTNKLEKSNVRVTVKRVAYTENLMPGSIGQYYVIVENISNTEQKDINVKFNFSEEAMTLKHIEEAEKEKIETTYEWTIDTISAGQYRVYSIFLEVNKINLAHVQSDLNAIITHDGKTYRSNVYQENLYGFDVGMKMTSPNEGEYLKTDDTIEYSIEIKNNSQIFVGLMFTDNVPEQLSIKKIEINGTIAQENVLDNSIYKVIDLEPNSTTTIKINTIVNYDRARLENETITNIANVSYAGTELATTETVKHIIETIVVKDEDELENPDNPVNPENPTDPDVSVNPEKPVDPENPVNPEQPEIPEKPTRNKYNISGKAWVDQDKDGQLNNDDTILKNIKVKLLNIETNEFVRNNESNKDLIVETTEEGYYEFENITEGKYIVVFEYDQSLYKPAIYQKEGIEESKNSNVVSKKLTVNGEEKEYAATNEINLSQNTGNINMGLVFIKQFDIKLNKYVSKVIVQTSKDTTTYDYENKDFVKVDISAKRMVGSTILVQYTIKATNTGDVDAYINSIVDYIPTGLKFSSELNGEWYENSGNLYTNTFEGVAIKPGESKEVNLILTKTKTDGNAELINNMAEIQGAYNVYGIQDLNSKESNKNKDENDLGSADLMISIQTGTVFNYIALVISMLGIIAAAAYIINKKVLKIRI